MSSREVGDGRINVPDRNGRKRAVSRSFQGIYHSHFINYPRDDRHERLDEQRAAHHRPWIPTLAILLSLGLLLIFVPEIGVRMLRPSKS